ncbi:MAG: Dna2/Cas4 domain-containing protein [Candidatus Thermoplasmatota archaeon]
MEVISASDVERYCYCPLSWWLGKKGKGAVSEAIEDGIKKHMFIDDELKKIRKNEVRVGKLDSIVLVSGGTATLVAFIGIIALNLSPAIVVSRALVFIALIWLLVGSFFLFRATTFSRKNEKLNRESHAFHEKRKKNQYHDFPLKYEKTILLFSIGAVSITLLAVLFKFSKELMFSLFLETFAIAWLIASSIFFYISYKKAKKIDEAKKDAGLNGEIIDEVLFSDKHKLIGKPDALLKVGENIIPIEIKTGRIPKGPLFSHILQLAVYCFLIEEKYSRPTHGFLRYGLREGKISSIVEYKIEYTDKLKEILMKKISEMRKAMEEGNVHRTHNRIGKCKNCSRREDCSEAIG